MAKLFVKGYDSRLEWKFDWAALTNGSGSENWLQDGETIASYTVAAGTGITVDDHMLANNDTSVIVWLDDGTVNTRYPVSCSIVTTAGREDKRTIYINVTSR